MFSSDEKMLSWIDYLLCSLVLLVSFAVGIYFGLSKKKAHTTEEYLLGGKSIKVLPIGLSLIATQISGTTMIAVPADIYRYGSNYIWTILGDIVAFTITTFVFLPLFYNLQVVSIFEYLEMRFDKNVRRFSSVLNLITMLLYAPVILYIPALVFYQMTGVDSYIISITICITCLLYTTVGGFKAVIWTDALQFSTIIGSITTVLAIGAKSVGGIKNAVALAVDGQRWDIFDFRVDLTSRNTFWASFIGNIFFTLSIFSVTQNFIQKYLALPTFSSIKRCICIHLIGFIIIKAIVILLGNIVYAKYAGCDVFKSGRITRTDELIPYFVMDVTRNLPGLPGLFFAGLLSAALSTFSSCLNATATTVYKDLIAPFITKNATQRKVTNIIKSIVLILGVLSMSLELIVEKIGGVFPVTTALQGIAGGPIVGIFVLGILFPYANAKGTLAGAVSAVLFTAWLVFGNLWYSTHGYLPNEEKPSSTYNCTFIANSTSTAIENGGKVFILYRISFWYYTLLSTIIVVIVGLVVSFFTRQRVCCFRSRDVPTVSYNVTVSNIKIKQQSTTNTIQ